MTNTKDSLLINSIFSISWQQSFFSFFTMSKANIADNLPKQENLIPNFSFIVKEVKRLEKIDKKNTKCGRYFDSFMPWT